MLLGLSVNSLGYAPCILVFLFSIKESPFQPKKQVADYSGFNLSPIRDKDSISILNLNYFLSVNPPFDGFEKETRALVSKLEPLDSGALSREGFFFFTSNEISS